MTEDCDAHYQDFQVGCSALSDNFYWREEQRGATLTSSVKMLPLQKENTLMQF